MKCVTSECDRVASSRGLCHKCYQAAWFWVHDGKGTWKDLEKNGYATPAKRSKPGTGVFTRGMIEGKKKIPDPDMKMVSESRQAAVEGRGSTIEEIVRNLPDGPIVSIPPYKEYEEEAVNEAPWEQPN